MSDINTLMKEIEAELETTAYLTGIKQLSESVDLAIRATPRKKFMAPKYTNFAHENEALPIGLGQTISQPFIVALMTEALRIGKNDTVLEIGTGSGYQAAVLSKIVKHVYSIEIIHKLAETSRERFSDLGYSNISVYCKDGHLGLPEYAPFDGIIVTAVSETIPDTFIEQLKPLRKLVIPLGSVNGPQMLTIVEKSAKGQISHKEILPVRFVPLVSK